VTGRREENDRPLSASGRAAARALVAELVGEPIAALYSSPYPRAVQTIEPLAAARGLDVTIVPDLRERLLSTGDLPDWEEHCRRSFGDFEYAPAGGESSAAAQARAETALAALAGVHPAQTIAVASHGNLIALMLHARDPSIGFAFWRAMPMPAVYRVDRE
jgi:broad specificity phosphatase PhoE